jgi:hypothetical protein
MRVGPKSISAAVRWRITPVGSQRRQRRFGRFCVPETLPGSCNSCRLKSTQVESVHSAERPPEPLKEPFLLLSGLVASGRVTWFDTKRAADRWLVETESEIIRGDWLDPELGKFPLGQYLDQWIKERDLKTHDAHRNPAAADAVGAQPEPGVRNCHELGRRVRAGL